MKPITRKNTVQTKVRSIQGFTLVESLVIIAIVAILATLSGTALMRWIPQSNLSRASRTIVSMAHHAKVEAIKRNQAVSFSCNNATNTCLVALTDGSVIRNFDISALQSNVSLTASENATFTGRGRLNTGATRTFTVTNSAGARTVQILSSGTVRTN